MHIVAYLLTSSSHHSCLWEWFISSENEIDWTSPDHSCPHFPVPICTTFFQRFWSETFFGVHLLHASALHKCKSFSLLSLGWLSDLKLVFQHFLSSRLSVLYAPLAVNIQHSSSGSSCMCFVKKLIKYTPKNKKGYTATFKLKVIEKSEELGNRDAVRQFWVDEKCVQQ